ncbi:hypothetical protein DLM76_21055 [Leptospira yasudae]|nr:hypothetical protein DLM76_21055 [Leptospira yasudae]
MEPKIKMSLVDLGLVYNIQVDRSFAKIEVPLASLASPFGKYLKDEIRNRILLINGLQEVKTQIV